MGVFKSYAQPKRRRSSPLLRLFLAVLFVICVAAAGVVYWYKTSLRALSQEETSIVITIQPGSTTSEIGMLLEENEVIRSATAFEWYVRLQNIRGSLLAGTYEFDSSKDTKLIAQSIKNGEISRDFITILPAQRLDQLRELFTAAGYSSSEIAVALKPETYANHPALAQKPAGKNLEGYLYPETYLKTADTPLTDVIKLSLDEFAAKFTPAIVSAFEKQGVSAYEGLIISSIVEREVGNEKDRRKVAQVFLKRFNEGIMLGSDPTALYGALISGIEPSVFADTPYNTRLYVGVTPTPINNVSVESLQAVANPETTDFLFFVSGDDGNTYFSRTLEEHEALTAQYCIELCQSY